MSKKKSHEHSQEIIDLIVSQRRAGVEYKDIASNVTISEYFTKRGCRNIPEAIRGLHRRVAGDTAPDRGTPDPTVAESQTVQSLRSVVAAQENDLTCNREVIDELKEELSGSRMNGIIQELSIAKRLNKKIRSAYDLLIHIVYENRHLFKIPDIKTPKFGKRKSDTVSATKMCNDEHLGELVTKDETSGRNEYGMKVFEQRFHLAFDKTLEFVDIRRNYYNIPTLYLRFNGDHTDGVRIYRGHMFQLDELRRTVQIMYYFKHASEEIIRMCRNFERVVLICTYGNHDRWGMVGEYHEQDNAAMAIYYMFKLILEPQLPNLTVEIAPNGEHVMQHGKVWIRQSHGHHIKSGSSIAGFPAAGMVSFHKNGYREYGVPKLIDLIGHFHCRLVLDDGEIQVAPSLVGMNDYAKRLRLSGEPGCLFYLISRDGKLFDGAVFDLAKNPRQDAVTPKVETVSPLLDTADLEMNLGDLFTGAGMDTPTMKTA